MEVKNLFDSQVKQEIIDRICKLNSHSPALWGKMNAAQMLAHVQLPFQIAYGNHRPKGFFFLRFIAPLFKYKLWNNQPYKPGLPTDPTFIMTGIEKNFEREKTALLELINRFSPGAIVCETHPIFGKFTKENWSKSNWKHLDHHLRQFGV